MMGRKCRWIVPAVLVIVTAGCDTAAYTVTERNEWRAAEEVILSEEIEDIDFDLTVFIENSWISQESGEEYHFTEISSTGIFSIFVWMIRTRNRCMNCLWMKRVMG